MSNFELFQYLTKDTLNRFSQADIADYVYTITCDYFKGERHGDFKIKIDNKLIIHYKYINGNKNGKCFHCIYKNGIQESIEEYIYDYGELIDKVKYSIDTNITKSNKRTFIERAYIISFDEMSGKYCVYYKDN
jgi:hypothetical protein